MSDDRHPVLAREGWVHVGIAVGVAALVHALAGWLWALPLWGVALFVVQFFRDPPRRIPTGPGVVVCPADGRVIAVDEVEDPTSSGGRGGSASS
jgi:phosphatidylserine decarboxylase